MSEMIERVRTALLAELRSQSESGGPYVDREEHPRSVLVDGCVDLIALSRAAVEAMREPTKAMLKASPIVGTGPNERGDWSVNTRPAEDVWAAMINRALADK